MDEDHSNVGEERLSPPPLTSSPILFDGGATTEAAPLAADATDDVEDTATEAAMAIQRELDDQRAARKKSKMQRMQERRKARDEAEARRKEMLAFYELSIIAASMDLLDVTKALFDLLEILPREMGHMGRHPRAAVVSAAAAEQQQPPRHRSWNQPLDDDDAVEGSISDVEASGHDFPPIGDDGRQMLLEAQSSAVFTHSFLLHTVESFFSRLGLLLHRRVGVGGVLLVRQQRYNAALVDVCAELPSDVVAMLNAWLHFVVVPPPIQADKAPFDVTTDDDVWQNVVRSTMEWLDLMHVDETLFDVADFRRLICRLGATFSLKRIARTIKEVARDLMSVLSAADMSGNVTMQEATPRPASRQCTTATPSMYASTTTTLRSSAERKRLLARRDVASPSHSVENCGTGSKTAAQQQQGGGAKQRYNRTIEERRELLLCTGNSAAAVRGQKLRLGSKRNLLRTSGVGDVRSLSSGGQQHDVTVSGKFLDPPLSLSAYSKLAPAQWLRQQRDTETLLGASKLHFGCEIGEPPIPSTQYKAVLQAKCSHYLYTARYVPTLTTVVDGGAGVEGRHDARDYDCHPCPKSSEPTSKIGILKTAVCSRLTTDGRVKADPTAHRALPPLTASQQLHLMAGLPTGAQLMLAKERATVAAGGTCSKRLPIAVVSRGSLPLQHGHEEGGGVHGASPHCNNVHLCLPRDAVARVLSAQSPEHHDYHGTTTTTTARSPSKASHFGSRPQYHHRLDVPTQHGCVDASLAQHDDSRSTDTLRDVLAVATLGKQSYRGDGTNNLGTPPLLNKKAKATVRYVTLLALQGKDQRLPSEDLSTYWQRLQAVAFKLSVLRAAGKAGNPTSASSAADDDGAQQQLWETLWASCNRHIDAVFQTLKAAVTAGGSSSGAVDTSDFTDGGERGDALDNEDDAAALRCMVSAVADGAMEGALKARRQQRQGDRDAIMARYGHNQAAAAPRCTPYSASPPPLGHFASPVQRAVKVSALEQRFQERGVESLFSPS